MTAKRTSHLRAIFLSFFSSDLYREVGQNWRGIGFSYLLLLVFIVGLFTVWHIQWLIYQTSQLTDAQGNNVVRKWAYDVAQQFPPVELREGKLRVQAAQPYIIRGGSPEKEVIVIDTTGTIRTLADTDASVLITRDEVMVRQYENDYEVYLLKDIREDIKLDAQSAKTLLDNAFAWIEENTIFLYVLSSLIILVFMILGLFVYRMLQVMLYGLVGIIFARMQRVDISYQTSVRLACVAITPAVMMGLFAALTWPALFSWWLYLVVTLVVLWFAVKANASELPIIPHTPS